MDYEERNHKLNSKLEKINKKLNNLMVDNFLLLETSSKKLAEESGTLTNNKQDFNNFVKTLEVYIKSKIYEKKSENEISTIKNNLLSIETEYTKISVI